MSFSNVEKSDFLGNLVEHYRFVVGSTVYRYTSAPIAQTLTTGSTEQNGTYTPAPITTTAPEHTRDAKGTRLRVTMPRNNPVAQLFRLHPPETEVRVQVFRKHVSDDEVITWWRGVVLSVDFRESEAQLECTPIMALNGGLGLWQKWQLQCNLPTYGARCGVNVADFTQSLTVSAISGNNITVSTHGQADGWFTGGYVETADGSRRHIEKHEGNVLTLMLNFDDLAVSDTVDVVAGDDHRYETCKDKFYADGDSGNPDGNVANFLGFFTTPGRNPFTMGGLTRAGATGFASIE